MVVINSMLTNGNQGAHVTTFWVGPAEKPDSYQLVRMLGGGGEGQVWQAHSYVSGPAPKDVAVKILPGRGPNDEREDWAEHASLLLSLSHPGVVRVTAAFSGPTMHPAGEARAGSYRYLVMDLVEGPHLREWLEQHSDSTAAERLRLLRLTADALDHMHHGPDAAAPVAHGDVKPSNIVVRPPGTPILVDLGLMRRVDRPGTAGRSAPYAAPEVRGSRPQATPEADRWAFVVTVAEVLIGGGLPTSRDSSLDLRELERRLRTSPGLQQRRGLPDRILDVLRADAEVRPRKLLSWVDGSLDSLSQVTSGRDAEDSPAAAAPTSRRTARRRLLIVLALVLVAAAVATGVVISGRLGTVAAPPLFDSDLSSPAPGWPVSSTDAEVSFGEGGYRVHPRSTQSPAFLAAPAPPTTFISDATVSATATLQGGQGIWGVWCRGADDRPSRSYVFLISHTAAVQITTEDYGDGTGWKHLDGVDVAAPVTVSAHCMDNGTNSSRPVTLTMDVNGRQVLEYQPATVFSPGYYGVTTQPFSDVTGPIATATFSHFAISRPPP